MSASASGLLQAVAAELGLRLDPALVGVCRSLAAELRLHELDLTLDPAAVGRFLRGCLRG